MKVAKRTKERRKEGRKDGSHGTFQNHDFDDKASDEDGHAAVAVSVGFGGGGESFVRISVSERRSERANGHFSVGRCPNSFLGLSLNDRSILVPRHLSCSLDKMVSVG